MSLKIEQFILVSLYHKGQTLISIFPDEYSLILYLVIKKIRPHKKYSGQGSETTTLLKLTGNKEKL